MVDVRPVYRVSEETIWDDASARRNACHKAILQALADRNIQALVTRSANGIYPAWVRVEAWLPRPSGDSELTNPRLRTQLELRFDVKPYHENTVTTSARAQIGKRAIAVADRPDFTVSHAVEWALYLIEDKAKPSNYTPVRDFFVNAVLSFVPFARTLHSNRISRSFRNAFPLTLPTALFLVGAIPAVIAFGILQESTFENAVLFCVLSGLFWLAAIIVSVRQTVIVSVPDRPNIPPRSLLRLDSWHAVVPGLGPQHEEINRRIAESLAALRPNDILTETERYGFRTPNGYDERDRLVISKGSGVAHLHIYKFAGDVFVGWDSYVNWAQWSETGAITRQTKNGRLFEYCGLQSSLYLPNEFDLIDLNSLIELIHRTVTAVLKAMMEEHKIDQEVDFKIIRGDRDAVLDQERYDHHRKQGNIEGAAATQRPRWRVT